MHSSSLQNWVPFKLISQEEDRLCQWMYTGDKKFTEPFFDHTILICNRLPQNMHVFKSTSTLEMMREWSPQIETVQPTAFIFHVSRCGSTLLAQMLGLNERNIVLSEVPFLDELLRLPFNKSNPDTPANSDAYFQSALHFYGQKKAGESMLFVKADSWHLLFYDRLRKLYPHTLFIFLYRSPADIIRSQKKLRGMHSVPGVLEPEVFGFGDADITYDLDKYLSRVLEKYFSALLNIVSIDNKFLLFNYQEGMLSIMNRVINQTKIETTPSYLEAIEQRMQFDGKRPSFFYNQEVAETNHEAYLNHCTELYRQLEFKRSSMQELLNKVQ